MSPDKRDLVTIDDLSNSEIDGIFSLADEMSDSIHDQSELCNGKIRPASSLSPARERACRLRRQCIGWAAT